MKMIKYFGALSVAGILMICAGCGDPVMPEPPTTDLKANITIRELTLMYPSSTNYAAIDTALYIEGVVTGNDVGGSLYKKIYVQDESAGIDVEIEMTQNCNKYPVGQRLVIDLNGLAFGRYGGQAQIGRQGGVQTERLYESDCDEHFHRKGYASAAEEIAPTPIKLSDATRSRYVGMLVRFDSVYFTEGGKLPFADVTATLSGNAQNNTLADYNGGDETLILRVSQYALFAMDTLPTGCGSIIGILGNYNGTPQLFIRDKNDLIGFEE
ncbi:MAG: hypothetical protein K2K11_03265 [Bacteroidales bacterium]|nr:hypothetical protein [Bacteroidales bacterium]